MEKSHSYKRRDYGSSGWARLALLQAALIVLLSAAGASVAQVRPGVTEMLESLALVNEIGAGLAVEDFSRISVAATRLGERTRSLRDLDITLVGLDAALDDQFDGFLNAQDGAARAVREAAQSKDANGVALALQQVLGNGCVSCHTALRDQAGLLRPSVLFMTRFLQNWQEMNRGLALGDQATIARHARELEALCRVLSWDTVIEQTFGIANAEERKRFRRLLVELGAEANRIEQAALEESIPEVLQRMTGLWTSACLECHSQFRKGR